MLERHLRHRLRARELARARQRLGDIHGRERKQIRIRRLLRARHRLLQQIHREHVVAVVECRAAVVVVREGNAPLIACGLETLHRFHEVRARELPVAALRCNCAEVVQRESGDAMILGERRDLLELGDRVLVRAARDVHPRHRDQRLGLLVAELRILCGARRATREIEAQLPLGARVVEIGLSPQHLAQQPRVRTRQRLGRAIVRERVVDVSFPLEYDGGIQLIVRIHAGSRVL